MSGFFITVSKDDLKHYGVLGMKWGVRRYQNKDGSLTSLGKSRYSKGYDVNTLERKDFLALIDSGKDFSAKKGTLLYRSTTNSNETMVGKKYVSVRASDVGQYHGMVRDLYPGQEVYDKTYETKKKVSVAGSRTQAKMLQEIYGKELSNDEKTQRYVQKGWLDQEKMSKPIDEMTEKELGRYLYYNPYNHNFDILNRPMSDPETKRYMDLLSERGYDAVVDMADTSINYADGPIIMLNAERSMKKRK